jgi:membrane-associated protein
MFYEKYGGKTIDLARFIPFVRTFAPFVAGIGQMRYLRFAVYNVTGGLAWVLLLLLAGYFLHNVPGVKGNFQYVILAIIFISVLPVVIELWRARREALAARSPAPAASDESREPLVREEAVEGRRGEE